MQPKRRKAPKKMRVQRTRVAIQTIPHEWPPSDAVQLGPYTLASGEYWVGDLCNVLKYEEWDEICGTEGFKTLGGGRDVVQFKLPEGGGIYAGKYGDRVHFIDSGTVGITLLEGLGPQAQATGHRTTYTDNFGCMSIKHRMASPRDVGAQHASVEPVEISPDSGDVAAPYAFCSLMDELQAELRESPTDQGFFHNRAVLLKAYGERRMYGLRVEFDTDEDKAVYTSYSRKSMFLTCTHNMNEA
ncbi:hypothetical protein T484DRAFT_1756900, partial [Baffinella frigidus]